MAERSRRSRLRTWICTAVSACTVEAYSQTVGMMLAHAEKAVYCGKERFEIWDVGDSVLFGPAVDESKLRFINSPITDAAAGVARMTAPNGCFVALRGTDGKISSLMDAMFWQERFDRPNCTGCKVDFGFHESYESIRLEIFQALEDFGCNHSAGLYLVGHSLGGAILHYVLFDVLRAKYRVLHAYALEPPRPGNLAFAHALRAIADSVDAVRVVHYRDSVVHLPPDALSYHHALPEIYYPAHAASEPRVCGFEDPSCSGQFSEPWELTFDDHLWYLTVNPCFCEMEPQMSKATLLALRQSAPRVCIDVFNVLAVHQDVAATCGQRIKYMYVDKDLSPAQAFDAVAREFPHSCGECAISATAVQHVSREGLAVGNSIGMLTAVLLPLLCVIVVAVCAVARGRRSGKARPDSAVESRQGATASDAGYRMVPDVPEVVGDAGVAPALPQARSQRGMHLQPTAGDVAADGVDVPLRSRHDAPEMPSPLGAGVGFGTASPSGARSPSAPWLASQRLQTAPQSPSMAQSPSQAQQMLPQSPSTMLSSSQQWPVAPQAPPIIRSASQMSYHV